MHNSAINATHRHALHAWGVLAPGAVHTTIHELGQGSVAEEIDWARSAPTLGDLLPSVQAEMHLLQGLAAAASLGLVTMRLTPVAGDSAAYHVCWQRHTRP